MSEYYLADKRAVERARERAVDDTPISRAQEAKLKLLGDSLLPGETQGFDPYNSTQGQLPRDAWSTRDTRR